MWRFILQGSQLDCVGSSDLCLWHGFLFTFQQMAGIDLPFSTRTYPSPLLKIKSDVLDYPHCNVPPLLAFLKQITDFLSLLLLLFCCPFHDSVQINFWKLSLSPFTFYTHNLYLFLLTSSVPKALFGFSFALLALFGVLIHLEPVFTEVSLLGVRILVILIYCFHIEHEGLEFI